MISEQAAALTRASFPTNFVWGTATAAYQIEGATRQDGRGASIWDTFSHTPGKTWEGQHGDVACDHFHHYRQDVALMRDMGLNGYRFSLSWPRVLPNGAGMVNQKGLDFYDRLVDELLENGIQPYATLYHWDLPQALQDAGGWKNRVTAQRFAEYADVVSRRLGDRVKGWITLNEPWCSAILGYITGYHAPGEKDLVGGVRATHHLLLAHGLAMPVLRRNVTRPDAEFGITLSLNYFEPGDDSNQAQEAAMMSDVAANGLFLEPLFKGQYPALLMDMFKSIMPIEPDDMDLISGPLDFLGVNYYFRTMPLSIEDPFSLKFTNYMPPESKYTAMGWEVYPQGLFKLLTRFHKEYNPAKIYITENGAAFDDTLIDDPDRPVVHDPDRLDYLREHFAAAQQAISEGVPLAGYFVWSLLDNFEWAFGYSKRFGITYVDYATQRRILKDSGRWYREFLRG